MIEVGDTTILTNEMLTPGSCSCRVLAKATKVAPYTDGSDEHYVRWEVTEIIDDCANMGSGRHHAWWRTGETVIMQVASFKPLATTINGTQWQFVGLLPKRS